jgi:mannose-6-phosphate isomerase-like protein (cupin superfamily)
MDTQVLKDIGPISRPLGASGATTFSMRQIPMLSQGHKDSPVAAAENLWLTIKVYANGGENSLHQHTVEDHAFVVLQGRATFHFGDGSSFVAELFEGVMVPKGVLYRFQADEAENLVLLRVGAAQRQNSGISNLSPQGWPAELKDTILDEDGTVKRSRTGVSKTPDTPPLPIPGLFFPRGH